LAPIGIDPKAAVCDVWVRVSSQRSGLGLAAKGLGYVRSQRSGLGLAAKGLGQG
jgi:hypothetical protein